MHIKFPFYSRLMPLACSNYPTLLSLNRFEKKKNAALAITSFSKLKAKVPELQNMRLVLAGPSLWRLAV
jgi:glycosyltransferase involved in cell wall biosynthesis